MHKMELSLVSIAIIAVIAAIAGALSATFIAPAFNSAQAPSQNDLIKEYYLVENAVKISPHSLRVKITRGIDDFTLVDLRSAEEYEKEHVVGAVSIPAYSDKDTSAYHDVGRFVSAFSALPKGKEVIVYCYSVPCMTGRKIGKILADRGIFVKHLGIGWNEWRYDWENWNHEHEWALHKVGDYVATGPAPGVFAKVNASAKSFCGPVDVGC